MPDTLALYRTLLRIRRAELKIVELYPEQEMRNPAHLYLGEEAIATGICSGLGEESYSFGTYRSHGVYLASGGDMRAMFAELYGKESGCSRGRGGSMHLVAPERGVLGCSAIVGGTIPIAVGTALATSIRGESSVSATFFGDGAADEGVLHEAMNFAALKKLPVVFVCENNFYATHSPQTDRQPADNLYRRAEVYGFPGVRVDGNDVLEVHDAARDAAERARRGDGPTFLECRTYRWKGHVGPEEDFDLGYRSRDEFKIWRSRDPIVMLHRYVVNELICDEEVLRGIAAEIDAEVDDAVRFAKQADFPPVENLAADVYAN